MLTIKIGEKTLKFDDGIDVEIAGDEIKAKPGAPAPQPIYVPLAVPYQQPYAPIYPTPWIYTQPRTIGPMMDPVEITCTNGPPITVGCSGEFKVQ